MLPWTMGNNTGTTDAKEKGETKPTQILLSYLSLLLAARVCVHHRMSGTSGSQKRSLDPLSWS